MSPKHRIGETNDFEISITIHYTLWNDFWRIYHKSVNFQDRKDPEAMLNPLKPFQIQWVLDNMKWLTTYD